MNASMMEEFLIFLGEHRAKHTVTAYRNDLIQFLRYLDVTNKNVTEIDKEFLTEYIFDLEAAMLMPASVSRKVSCLKTFYRYLYLYHNVPNPTDGLKTPRTKRTIPTALTADEVDRLLKQPTYRKSASSKRNHLMLVMLYSTGLHVNELVGLNVDDVEVKGKRRYLVVNNKHKPVRYVPLIKSTAREVKRYLESIRPELNGKPEEKAFFLNQMGTRLTRQSFWVILRECSKGAGISRWVTPSIMRISFAHHVMSGGMKTRKVRELLGHSFDITTAKYKFQAAPRSGVV